MEGDALVRASVERDEALADARHIRQIRHDPDDLGGSGAAPTQPVKWATTPS